MPQRATVTVHGLVQGVGFRLSTRRQAELLGLRGTVCNRPDGSVRIVAEGERAVLDALVAWAQAGPPRAAVANVEVAWGEAEGRFPDFTIAG